MANAQGPVLSAEIEASTSAPTRSLCSICNHQYSIYTCPRCSTRTCSLPCSAKHKTNTGCTGERNKAAYVPMNEYGWGTMMNDYVFLEDVGRKVNGWGREIVKGGFDITLNPEGKGRGLRARGRGRGAMARGLGRIGRTKRELLKIQLDIRDVDMELLPNGMEKRKLNQSIWDFKKQTAFLTIEFKLHRPRDPAAPSFQPLEPPMKFITHRNNGDTSLLTLIQAYVTERARSKSLCPAWVSDLVLPDPDDPDSFHPPAFVMRARMDPEYLARTRSNAGNGYYQLDHSQKLLNALRGTHFVEFPVIEVWEEFRGTIINPSGEIDRAQNTDDIPKRRRMDARAGKKAINSLLGGYGSDEDEGENSQNVMSALGEYNGSEDEGDDLGSVLDAEGETDEDMEIDPAVVLELIQKARADLATSMEDNDDDVDWGDSGDDGE